MMARLARGASAALALLAVLGPVAAGALPGHAEVRDAWRPSQAALLDRHGHLVHEVRLEFRERRLPWVALEEMSRQFLDVVVGAEYKRFDSHGGVDWTALASATVDRVVGQGRRGASTISMQLASLLSATPGARPARRTLRQKWDQIQEARALEQGWSKPQILEAYLNLVFYRGELRGIGAASHGLFRKPPSGLTETESLVLAALLPSPNAPPARVAERACGLARARGTPVSCAALRHAVAEVLVVSPEIAPAAAIAPHLARQLLRRPGEQVTSTLDAAIQRVAVEAIRSQVTGLGAQNVRDAAALVVDNATGDVLAYVGGSGVESRAPSVDGVRALRQAGSTLKPFLYAAALERGYLTAASLVEDSPVHLETTAGLYIPQNYDRDFKGTVSVRTALASSLNVPAVRTLVLIGVDAFHEQLRALGYGSLTEGADYYGYALALGSPEVSLLEQVNAYRTLANGGVASDLRLRKDDPPSTRRRVITAEAAFVISDILSDRAGRSVTFGLANALGTPFWTAVKTGTSKNMRDNWCVGYSRDYTVGVWVGNLEGDPMWDVSGVTGAAPIWLDIMRALHGGRPSVPPRAPRTLVQQPVRFEPAVEPERPEWFPVGRATSVVRLLSPDRAAPRIEYPAHGMIMSVDPDIPPSNQAVLFQRTGPEVPLRWVLDGVDFGARTRLLWPPTPGRHRLGLLDADDRLVDEVRFQVRGATAIPREDSQ